MKEIRLLNSHRTALVDDEDFEFLSTFRWYVKYYNQSIYASTVFKKKLVTMHRIIMGFPPLTVDHIDGNGLNNQRENLRICTKAENLRNKQKFCGTSSIFKGVYWNTERKKWQAQISVNNKNITLGRFHEEKEAARAYNVAAKKYYGDFANLNFIQEGPTEPTPKQGIN